MAIKLETDLDKFSYGLAMNITASVKQLPVKANEKLIAEAVTELLNGGMPQLSPDEYAKIMQEFQGKLQEAAQKQQEEMANSNLEAGKKFLAENGKKEGVVTTKSGLQYTVLNEGDGASPKADSTVRVHYEGKLLDGQIFDSSLRRGEPAEFPVNQVIPGWTEALQLMKKGAKYRLFIPSDLAYGARGAGQHIAPNSTLLFDVELLEIL